jgi:hypothetical protein
MFPNVSPNPSRNYRAKKPRQKNARGCYEQAREQESQQNHEPSLPFFHLPNLTAQLPLPSSKRDGSVRFRETHSQK